MDLEISFTVILNGEQGCFSLPVFLNEEDTQSFEDWQKDYF